METLADLLRSQVRSPARSLAPLHDWRPQLVGCEDLALLGKAGRLLREAFAAHRADGVRVLLLGQCTLSLMPNPLTAMAWADGAVLEVSEGGYDAILPELWRAEGNRFDVIVLVPWPLHLFDADGRADEARLDEEMHFWNEAWRRCHDGLGARIVQVGYDWILPGAGGHFLDGAPGGAIDTLRRLDDRLRRELPAGDYFLDLAQVSGIAGRNRFYDLRTFFWTKQPFSQAGLLTFCQHVWAGIRAVRLGPKKLLVLDLDGTLWNGVLGEAGPLGIAADDDPAGEAFGAFRRHLRQLSDRGVLLAVASKNNPEDVAEAFAKNPHLLLAPEDFATMEIGWGAKSTALRRIAERLNLGLDQCVFFDNEPAEREEVRQALPEVAIVPVPEDPAYFIPALHAGLWFESAVVTAEDRERKRQYRDEARRQETRAPLASLDDYWRSLEMLGRLQDITDANLPRVAQLIGRTNQFNLCNRRHGPDAIRELVARKGAIALVLDLQDRFGDYGMISVLIAVPAADEPATLRIDTWLMSCRAINRTAEYFLFEALVQRALEAGYRDLAGEYIATRKNSLVAGLYDQLGFSRPAGSNGETTRYRATLATLRPPRHFVRRVPAAGPG
jgi:FkbH-like protein